MEPSDHVILITAVAAFVIGAGFHMLALLLFPRWGFLDFPERYGLQRSRLPYPTGILSVIAFLLLFLCKSIPLETKEVGLVAGIILLAAASFIDDRRQLPAWLRILIQIVVCILIFATGSRIYTITSPLEPFGLGAFLKLDTLSIPGGPFGPLPVWSGLFTVLWLGLTMNALNWFDGIPGQVSTISVIGFAMLGCLALSDRVNQPDIALLAFMLCALAGAALLFDMPPGRVLMGDTGAMFFGLMLGVLGIYQGGKVATAFLALGIPLFDAIFVTVRRISRGASPFRGNRDHLHHRLLARGWSVRGIVLLTAIIGGLFGITALFLDTTEKGVAVVVLFALMLVLTRYSRTPQ